MYGFERDFWNTWRELERFQAFDSAPWPALNAWHNDDGGLITAQLPGIDPESLDISVRGDEVTLKATRSPTFDERATYQRRETQAGEFTRTVQLPFKVDASKVDASLSQGILTVTLPRAQEDRPRRISIKAS